MMIKDSDPRFQKIHKALQESLMRLIDEKPFAKITVNEIADVAEINRSTFYSHYPDILALLNDCLMAGVTLKDDSFSEDDVVNNPENLISRTKRYLQFSFDHPDLYLMVLKEFQTNAYFSEFNEALINELCEMQKRISPNKSQGLIPARQTACFVLAGQASLLRCWLLKKPPQPIDKLAILYNVVETRVICSLLECEVPEWVNAFEQSNRLTDH